MENSSNNTIDLRRLFNLCRKHLKFLITCTIALALAGFIVSKFIMTPKYTATTQLLVNQKNENNANGQAYANQQADIQVINTYKDIINSPVILKETKKELANPVKVIRKAQPAKYKTLADGTKRLVSAAKPAKVEHTGQGYSMTTSRRPTRKSSRSVWKPIIQRNPRRPPTRLPASSKSGSKRS